MNQDELTKEKIQAEIAKIFVEIEKMRTETRWYPFVVSTSLVLVALGVFKLIS